MNKPKVGDRVIHHGHLHEITRIIPKAVLAGHGPEVRDIAVWENDGFEVKGFLDELVWSDADAAWYLPGRILARNERAVCQAITGAWPPAENHLAMRSMLDSVDFATVNRDKLKTVLKERKVDVRNALAAAKARGDDPAGILDGYADACLEQCAGLRALRKEG